MSEEDWMHGKKKLTLCQKIRKWFIEHDMIMLSVDDLSVDDWDQFCRYLCADCFDVEDAHWEEFEYV